MADELKWLCYKLFHLMHENHIFKDVKFNSLSNCLMKALDQLRKIQESPIDQSEPEPPKLDFSKLTDEEHAELQRLLGLVTIEQTS